MKYLLLLCTVIFLSACESPSAERNLNDDQVDLLESKELEVDITPKAYQDTIYVPIYSDIYTISSTIPTLLAATLSIRSTSFSDTTYIHQILYYNTKGTLVKDYLHRTLALPPMQSIDYLIEREDTSGGNGANFIVTWSADKDTQPLFEAIMVSAEGNKAFSFTSRGISLRRN